MRIAIAGNFGLAGKQTMAVRALPLAQALVARGHQVCLILPIREPGDGGGPSSVNGVAIRHAGRGPRLAGLSHLWQLLLMAWHCLRCRPNVLYGFKPMAYSGALLLFFWWLRRLHLFHGILALDTDDWEGEGGWNDRQPFPGWVKRLVAAQELWSLRHAHLVSVASRTLEEMAASNGAGNVLYLPNALAPTSPGLRAAADSFGLKARLGLREHPVVLVYTRFVEFQPSRLLDAFEVVARSAENARLLVVGTGLNGEEADLRRLAADRGLAEKLLLAGWVPMERLPDYFALADVALYLMDDRLLNRAKCPMKLLDLLAAGAPVVADRVGQAAEYISDDETGLLVAPGDSSAMGAAAAALLADPKRRQAMGRAASADARARWKWERLAAEVEAALNQVESRH